MGLPCTDDYDWTLCEGPDKTALDSPLLTLIGVYGIKFNSSSYSLFYLGLPSPNIWLCPFSCVQSQPLSTPAVTICDSGTFISNHHIVIWLSMPTWKFSQLRTATPACDSSARHRCPRVFGRQSWHCTANQGHALLTLRCRRCHSVFRHIQVGPIDDSTWIAKSGFIEDSRFSSSSINADSKVFCLPRRQT